MGTARRPDSPLIFLSYRRKDTLYVAHALKYALEAQGFRVFIDTAGIEFGEVFKEEIRREFAQASLTLALIDPSFDFARLARPDDTVAFEWRTVTTRPCERKPAWAICGGSVFGREAKAKPTGTYLRHLPEQIAHAG
jgi:hypothetical protein